jgi:hypothetical protein
VSQSALDLQRERAAKNQSLFREVNERIEQLASRSSYSTFVCECMDESCAAEVTLTIEQYEHVRSGGNHFLVLPGHNVPKVEDIVEASDRYLIVRKLGAGLSFADALEPRARQQPDRDPAHRHVRAAERHEDAARRPQTSVEFWKTKR